MHGAGAPTHRRRTDRFRYIAKRQITERNESRAGMATAGILLGWVGIGFLALFIGIAIVAALTADNSTSFD